MRYQISDITEVEGAFVLLWKPDKQADLEIIDRRDNRKNLIQNIYGTQELKKLTLAPNNKMLAPGPKGY